MSEALFEASSRIAEESGFDSLQEYFRNALREINHEYRKRKVLGLLEKNFGRGKGKPIKRMTREERKAWTEEQIKKAHQMFSGA